MLGIIKRTFKFLDEESFLALYKTMVRPILEYCNIIWHPLLIRQSTSIESIQRRATKMIKSLSSRSYGERLRSLNLPTLKYRRLRADMIQAYKIFHELDEVDINSLFTFPRIEYTRGHEFKIMTTFCQKNVRKNCFPMRIVKWWNSLAEETVNASNINLFKARIDEEFSEYVFDFD